MPCLWVTRQFSLLSVLALARCALGGLFFPCCLTQVSWGRLPYALWRPEIPWKGLSALLVTAASRSWNPSPLDEFLSPFQFRPLHSVCYPPALGEDPWGRVDRQVEACFVVGILRILTHHPACMQLSKLDGFLPAYPRPWPILCPPPALPEITAMVLSFPVKVSFTSTV